MEDPVFREHVLSYAADQSLFFKDFALAFGKLIELGVDRDDTGFAHLVRKAAEEGKPLDQVDVRGMKGVGGGGGCPFMGAVKRGETEAPKRESKL